MSNIIEVRELKKSYGENSVLKGVNLAVRKGEIFALLGANGAGKTTTMECIEGLRAYDGGQCNRERENRHSVTVVFFTSPYQTYGSRNAFCEMEQNSTR